MENSKSVKEKNRRVENDSLNVMTKLVQEAEQIITEAGEAAGREAEQELEKVLQEYEQKTRQIILKVREKTKSKTVEMANRLSEAVMLGIEKASAKAVAGVVSELSNKAGELTKKMQEAAEKEAGQAISRIAVGLGGGESPANRALKEDLDTAGEEIDDTNQETEFVTEEEGIELKQPAEAKNFEQPVEAENFDQWLAQ